MRDDKTKTHFVLVAGFSSDNQEVLGLKNILEESGYSATAISFYGPGFMDDFTELNEEACLDNLAKIVSDLAGEDRKVFGIGISLGGALLLEHAKNNSNLDGIVSIGTPFRLKNKKIMSFGRKIFPALYLIWRKLQKIESLRLWPLGAAPAMLDFMEKRFLEDLEKISVPTLFMHSRRDGVTDYLALDEYLPRISSTKKEVIFFKNGNHVISYNPLIASEAFSFFNLNQKQIEKESKSNILPKNMEDYLEFEKIDYN